MNTNIENLTWDFIIENEIATQQELKLVTDISGYNMNTFNSVIYSRTAYHDVEQLYDCERELYYFSDEILEYIENN